MDTADTIVDDPSTGEQDFPVDVLATAVAVLVVSVLIYLKVFWHPVALKKEFQAFPLIAKQELSHDVRRFTFGLPSARHQLGLPVGQHIKLRFTDTDGKSHQRNYTPVTDNEDYGHVSFVIKIYYAGVNPKFPNGGKVSQHLDSLKIGDTMDLMGPTGHAHWFGKGKFEVKPSVKKPVEQRYATHLNMVAGGTGITPMLQVLHAIFKDPADKTVCSLVYANQTPDDILVQDELEGLAKKYPTRFKTHYTVDRDAPKDWKYDVGFISKEMLDKHFYGPKDGKVQTFMCGPPPMVRFACLPNLKAMGFTEEDWFAF